MNLTKYRIRPSLAALFFAMVVPQAASAAELPVLPTYGQPEEEIVVTAIELAHPKKSADRAEGGANHVLFSLWVPPGRKVVRGVYFAPFNLDTVEKSQSRAMARHWGFAIVGSNFMRVHKDDFAPALVAGLKDLAHKSGHAEVEHAPLIAASMSAGAGMCVTFAEQLPERTIACGLACLEVGPQTERTREVPMLTIFGERDGKQMIQLGELLPKQRAAFDARWGTAVQWSRKHEWGQSNNLLWPMFDEVIRQRLPGDADTSGGPIKLQPCDAAQAWLGDPATWKSRRATIAPIADYQGDKTQACWFPDERTAHVWQAFVVPEPIVKITSPQPQGDGQPLTVYAHGEPIAVRVACPADFNGRKLELFDGAQRLGEAAIANGQVEVQIDELSPGIHSFIAHVSPHQGEVELSRPVTVLVSAKP